MPETISHALGETSSAFGNPSNVCLTVPVLGLDVGCVCSGQHRLRHWCIVGILLRNEAFVRRLTYMKLITVLLCFGPPSSLVNVALAAVSLFHTGVNLSFHLGVRSITNWLIPSFLIDLAVGFLSVFFHVVDPADLF